MKRRDFTRSALIAVPGASLVSGASGLRFDKQADVPFNLNYAPHFGMFGNSAGKDPLDQLKFMHERGFRAMEDNGMKGRSVEDQQRIANEMERTYITNEHWYRQRETWWHGVADAIPSGPAPTTAVESTDG